MNSRFGVRKITGILTVVILGVLVFGGIVMVLWNGLMPVIFHLPLIDFWQALGLFALAKILFGNLRGGPVRRWRDGLRDKWGNMTPEQREKFKEEWSRRCGRPFPDDRFRGRSSAGQPDNAGQA